MMLETTCPDCGMVYDQLRYLDGCPSIDCIDLKLQRKRAVAAGKARPCWGCRHWFQSPQPGNICPDCQAKHDAAVAREQRLKTQGGT